MGLAHSPSIVTANLSLLFDPANSKCYPGTGTTLYDLSGNGNHGNLLNGVVPTNGVLPFDGVNDGISVISNQTSLNFSSEQTIGFWMYHTFTSGRRNPWNQAYGGYGTWTHESGANINYYYGNAGTNATPYTAVNSGATSTGVWNFMCITRNTSTIKWYKNGVNIGTVANIYGVLTTTTANIAIGYGYAGYWMGNMGQIMAYNRALSATEIQQNFNALKSRHGL